MCALLRADKKGDDFANRRASDLQRRYFQFTTVLPIADVHWGNTGPEPYTLNPHTGLLLRENARGWAPAAIWKRRSLHFLTTQVRFASCFRRIKGRRRLAVGDTELFASGPKVAVAFCG